MIIELILIGNLELTNNNIIKDTNDNYNYNYYNSIETNRKRSDIIIEAEKDRIQKTRPPRPSRPPRY